MCVHGPDGATIVNYLVYSLLRLEQCHTVQNHYINTDIHLLNVEQSMQMHWTYWHATALDGLPQDSRQARRGDNYTSAHNTTHTRVPTPTNSDARP